MFKSTLSSSKNHPNQLLIGGGGGGGGARGVGRGRSKSKPPSTTCKKHPKHEQSPGVCAVCLREKLTHIPASSSKITRGNKNKIVSASTSSYLSSLSSHESSNPSSSSSPVHRRSYSSMTTFLKFGKKNNNSNSSKNIVLTKSRSLAYLMQRTEAEEAVVDKHHGKKKQGFWAKLLRPRTRNKE